MPFVPPWLDVNPMSFLDAAAKGAQIGQAQAELAQHKSQAAGELGLGYARLKTESAQAAAAQKEAQARLALEQNRLTQLGQLGQERIGLSTERLGETEKQHGAANQLATDRLGVQTNNQNSLNSYRDRLVDLATQKFDSAQGTAEEKRAMAEQATDDFLGFMSDPMSKTNPQATLAKYPHAVDHPSFGSTYKDLNPTGGGPVATFMGRHGTTVRIPVSGSDAASLLGTNGPASLQNRTPGAATGGGPVKGTRVLQDGTTYEFDGANWNPVSQ